MTNIGYHYENRIFSTRQTLAQIDQSIKQQRGFALARFGIGEMTILVSNQHPSLLNHFSRFSSYAGITSSTAVMRNELLSALKTAEMVGLTPSWKLPFWAKMTRQFLKEKKIKPAKVCCPWIMHDAVAQGVFWKWIAKKRVVLVGRRAATAVPLFTQQGIAVVGSIDLEGFMELNEAYESLLNLMEWDMAIISAGIPATILAPKISKATNKVAIDFGHALDMLLDGDHYNHLHLVQKFNIDENNQE